MADTSLLRFLLGVLAAKEEESWTDSDSGSSCKKIENQIMLLVEVTDISIVNALSYNNLYYTCIIFYYIILYGQTKDDPGTEKDILCERTHMYDFLSKVKMQSFIGQTHKALSFKGS